MTATSDFNVDNDRFGGCGADLASALRLRERDGVEAALLGGVSCRLRPVGRTRLPVMALAGRGIGSTVHRTITGSEVTSGAGGIPYSARR
jgi:hypothetical protein